MDCPYASQHECVPVVAAIDGRYGVPAGQRFCVAPTGEPAEDARRAALVDNMDDETWYSLYN